MKTLIFCKTLSPSGLCLPSAVLRISDFASNEEAEVRPIQDAVVVLKRHIPGTTVWYRKC